MHGLQTMTKVKASDKFRFPLELDLGAYLPHSLTGESAQYDLTAILIHKGTSASHGHYGARPARLGPSHHHLGLGGPVHYLLDCALLILPRDEGVGCPPVRLCPSHHPPITRNLGGRDETG